MRSLSIHAGDDDTQKKSLSVGQPIEFSVAVFSLRDRLAAVCSVFLSTLRLKFLLRVLGCSYGRSLRIDGKVIVRVRRKGAITVGDNFRVNSRFMANLAGLTNHTVLHCWREGSIKIGNNSGCSSTIMSSRSSIVIGDNVNIGANVRIFDHDFHSLDYRNRRDPLADAQNVGTSPVMIGNDVFIGTNALILKGVHIGDRSVVGAGAVVALKSIPPDSVVVGNPGKVVRRLLPTP